MPQKFADVVPSMRESVYDGNQVQVSDLLDKTFNIVKAQVGNDDRGEWADVQIEHDGEDKTFISGSKTLIDAVKSIVGKNLLDKDSIEATLRSKRSKSSNFSYYIFE